MRCLCVTKELITRLDNDFGINVSDIYRCARLAYVLYDELKQAPGACWEFARDLLLFHQVLLKSKSTIECEANRLSDSDEATLMICLDSCKELLYVQIADAHMKPLSLERKHYTALLCLSLTLTISAVTPYLDLSLTPSPTLPWLL